MSTSGPMKSTTIWIMSSPSAISRLEKKRPLVMCSLIWCSRCGIPPMYSAWSSSRRIQKGSQPQPHSRMPKRVLVRREGPDPHHPARVRPALDLRDWGGDIGRDGGQQGLQSMRVLAAEVIQETVERPQEPSV